MWQQGRQGGNYYKKSITIFKRLDLHILKIDPQTFVPIHRDLVESGRHRRINITILGGGILFIRRKSWGYTKRNIVGFEPGAVDHAFQNGNRTTYQISIGWRI